MTAPTKNLAAAWLEAKKKATAAYDAGDALAMVEHEMTADLLRKKEDFVRTAATLANRLLDCMERVEGAPLDHHTLNSLGEVQATGQEVDGLCREIGALRDVLKGVASARKAAER
jgi:hypothetical protein